MYHICICMYPLTVTLLTLICKSTWICTNTILRIVQGTKGICRSQGKEHNSQTKTDKTTRGKQCGESNIIKKWAVTLPLCGLFFGTVIHFVRCVRKSWRKEEKLNYIQVKWRERQRYRSRSFCILMRNRGQKCSRSLCYNFWKIIL